MTDDIKEIELEDLSILGETIEVNLKTGFYTLIKVRDIESYYSDDNGVYMRWGGEYLFIRATIEEFRVFIRKAYGWNEDVARSEIGMEALRSV